MSGTGFFIALIGGFLPALVWLWFWLREDSRCPEPKSAIVRCFLAGIAAVLVVLPFEKAASGIYAGTALILTWSVIEEVVKLGAAYFAGLSKKDMNEPIDAVIYLITVALGFAAFENMLFLLQAASAGTLSETFITGNFRFLGASLLHTLCSAVIGASIALAFYKKRIARIAYMFAGVIGAISLHAVFNLAILDADGERLLAVFVSVWIGIILLMLLLEKIKLIAKPKLTQSYGKR